jgi:hypothetical protein
VYTGFIQALDPPNERFIPAPQGDPGNAPAPLLFWATYGQSKKVTSVPGLPTASA